MKEKIYSNLSKIKDALRIEELVIDLQKESLDGNVLDISVDNQGIIYNLCKNSDEEVSVDYFDEEHEEKNIYKGSYDVAVLFFTASKFINKKKLLKEVYEYLKEGGEIRIWDIDKTSITSARFNIKILLPGQKEKYIKIRDLNILKNNSKEDMSRQLVSKFDILEMRAENNIYYIKGRKRKELNKRNMTITNKEG